MTLKQGPLLASVIFTIFLLSPLKAGLSPLIISYVIWYKVQQTSAVPALCSDALDV